MKERNLTSTAVNQTELPPIGQVMVQVPYNKPGNVVEHLPVRFMVFGNGANFKAIPLCSQENQRIANLPPFINFQVKGGKTMANTTQGTSVAEDIVDALSKKRMC